VISRRGFLRRAAPAALAPWLPGCRGADRDQTLLSGVTLPASAQSEAWPEADAESPFLHGVASGDPLSDAVILWTRVTPPEGAEGEASAIDVEWRIATDPELKQLVGEGSVSTDADSDFTLHVDATGLAAGTSYYFQFRALGASSVRGRTRTLPAGAVPRMRLGVVSCANYPGGYFNVYGLLASADVDLVLHLGDYIYEFQDLVFGNGAEIERAPDPPRELSSLDDYRRRHAQYKLDPDSQALHRQHPMIAIWDDHEVANDAYQSGAGNHQRGEGDYAQRKAAALQAYREWLPLRTSQDPAQLYRSFACGELLDLVLLDTRHAGRQPQLDRCESAGLAAPERQLLGAAQEAWLAEQLRASQARGARWRLIGQQVIMAPRRAEAGCVVSADAWDGYAGARTRLLDALERDGIDNVVVLTGDAHSSWACDVPREPFDPAKYDPATGAGSQLVELVTPAVSSPPRGGVDQLVRSLNPHIKYVEQSHQGFVLLDVTPERVLGEWYLVPTVRARSAQVELGAALQTRDGQPHLVPAEGATLARSPLPAPAR
jgi:alkaline phosphatase D